jgi:cytochrome b561
VHARNGEHGYGAVTKVLHWLTVALLAAQLALGLTMEADAAAERAEEAAEAREEAAEDLGEAAEDAADAEADRAADTEYLVGVADGVDLLDLHVLVGVSLLVLAVVRVLWRRVGGLPPWSEALSAAARRFAAVTEKVLLASLFAVPLTGLTLVLTQDDGLVAVHVAAQLLLGVAVLAHVALVLRHTVVRRDGLLARMLPSRRP